MTKRAPKEKKPRPTSAPASAASSRTLRSMWISSRWQTIFQALALIAAAILVYWPPLNGNWIWDDTQLVSENVSLHSLHGLWQIWFGMPATDYWPLTWTVLWIEWHLWGNYPLGYHIVSLVLHLSSAFLIWSLFNRLRVGWAWFGALLFVVHPLAVESVAWISEIKNTLSLPFFLLSLHAYLDGERGNKRSPYLRSLLFYILAMLSKTSTVMLPIVILFYKWWKNERLDWTVIKRLSPYLAVAIVLGIITIYFQNAHAPENQLAHSRGPIIRFIGAGTAACFYLGKYILPTALIPIYPHWVLSPPSILQLLTLPALAVLLLTLYLLAHSSAKYILLGLGFFFINLIPVVGILNMSYMNTSWVADHLVYLPMIGLVALTAAGLHALYKKAIGIARSCVVIATTIMTILLIGVSRNDAKHWTSNETLWAYTVQRSPNSALVHNAYGYSLSTLDGHLNDAILQYKIALTLDPLYANAHYNLGYALAHTPGHLQDGVLEYEEALRNDPSDAEAHIGIGNAYEKIPGRVADAVAEYQLALRIKPGYVAYNRLANALSTLPGHSEDAALAFRAALDCDPSSDAAHYNLGNALAKIPGRLPDAEREYEIALKLNPSLFEAHTNLGAILLAMPGRMADAVAQFRAAYTLRPTDESARRNLQIAEQRLLLSGGQ